MKKNDFTAEIAASFLEKKGITDSDVMPAFATISGNSRVSFVAVTDVAVSAASKKEGIKIQKASVVICAIYSGLKPSTNPYLNKLLNAGKLEHELKENWFYHYNSIFSLVAKKSDNLAKYLYTLPDSGKSFFFVNGLLVDKADIYQHLTPSEVKKMTTKVEYDFCRVYALSSIKQITCLGDIITA